MRKSCRDLKQCQLRGLDEPAHPKARIMEISRSSCDMVAKTPGGKSSQVPVNM